MPVASRPRAARVKGTSRPSNPAREQAYNALVRDLIFIAVTVGFFALAALVVAACDRIVGPDPTDLTVATVAATDAELVAR